VICVCRLYVCYIQYVYVDISYLCINRHLFQNGQLLLKLVIFHPLYTMFLLYHLFQNTKTILLIVLMHILLLRKELYLPDSSVDLGGEGRLADDGNTQGLRHSFSVNTTMKNFIKIFMICLCPYIELKQPPSSMQT
jgi:hypothetical protein